MDWKLENLDDKTMIRALSLRIKELDATTAAPRAVFVGSKGDLYTTTLESCDCVDYQVRGRKDKRPCKHIALLLMESGRLDRAALNEYLDFKSRREKELEQVCRACFLDHVIHGKPLPSEEPVKPAAAVDSARQPAPAARVIEFLDSEGVEYVDMGSKGGSVYFFDKDAAEKLKSMGYAVEYARKGTRSTSYRPAWYIRF